MLDHDSPIFALLRDSIAQVIQKNVLLRHVEELRRTSYNPSNPTHKKLIEKLWRGLCDEHVPEIPSERWKEIGFQGTDPATDFRGMGMLSLHQLVSSLTVHPDIKELCHEAQHGPYWYSFAAVAINVTASIHQMLLDGDLDEINYRTGCKLSSLAEIHYEVMKLFHKNWMDARPANLFFFNDIFANTKLEFQVQMGIKR